MLIKRNVSLFFRDKTSIFFSLLGIIIMLALFILFLGESMENILRAYLGNIQSTAMTRLVLGGMIAATSVTASVGAAGRMVADRDTSLKDFLTSPISRLKITVSYIGSAAIVSFMMTMAILVASLGYLVFRGSKVPTLAEILLLLLTALLCALSANAMIFCIAAFLKSREAYGSVTSVVGTLVGFLMGIYIPIGQLPPSVGWAVRLFPLSHGASMFRMLLADRELSGLFANVPPNYLQEFREFFGVTFRFGNVESNFWFSALTLIGTTLIFYTLGFMAMRKKKY